MGSMFWFHNNTQNPESMRSIPVLMSKSVYSFGNPRQTLWPLHAKVLGESGSMKSLMNWNSPSLSTHS